MLWCNGLGFPHYLFPLYVLCLYRGLLFEELVYLCVRIMWPTCVLPYYVCNYWCNIGPYWPCLFVLCAAFGCFFVTYLPLCVTLTSNNSLTMFIVQYCTVYVYTSLYLHHYYALVAFHMSVSHLSLHFHALGTPSQQVSALILVLTIFPCAHILHPLNWWSPSHLSLQSHSHTPSETLQVVFCNIYLYEISTMQVGAFTLQSTWTLS